jgi:hypothetical protein
MARLERQTTDIVISINIPHVRDESSEGEGGLEVEEEASLEKASEVKKKIMESFEIKDWSLFGEG